VLLKKEEGVIKVGRQLNSLEEFRLNLVCKNFTILSEVTEAN